MDPILVRKAPQYQYKAQPGTHITPFGTARPRLPVDYGQERARRRPRPPMETALHNFSNFPNFF